MDTFNNKEVFDTLRLTPRERDNIIDQLNKRNDANCMSNRRIDKRVRYNVGKGIEISIDHPGGSSGNYLVQPVDLSATGLGFLHGCFVYHDSLCKVRMMTPDGESVLFNGKVVRCSHLQRNIHEVAIRFDKPIETTSFFPQDDSDDQKAEPLPDRGRILYIDEIKSCRTLMAFQTKKLGIETISAGGIQEALQLMKTQSFDMIFVDLWLGKTNGLKFIEQLRGMDYNQPLVLVTAEDAQETRPSALAKGASDVLAKPHAPDELEAMFDKHLSKSAEDQNQDLEPIHSDFWSDSDMQPMILDYLDWLQKEIVALEQAAQENDAPQAISVCRKIKGSAGNFGYPQIVEEAEVFMKKIIDDFNPQMHDFPSCEILVNDCQAACLFKELCLAQ